jgi:NAD(P)-dependent dehydrogenase (short-subunit alcohol dehydrogenase family)
VAITHLREEQSDAEETRATVEAEGQKALLIKGDVRKSEFCRRAVERTAKEFGKLDILVNNAAFQQHQKKLEDINEKQWDRTFKTNIYGYFYMTKAALPHLPEGSAIINTGSITGLEGSKELLDYAATKGAIHAFTRSLAQNLV